MSTKSKEDVAPPNENKISYSGDQEGANRGQATSSDRLSRFVA